MFSYKCMSCIHVLMRVSYICVHAHICALASCVYALKYNWAHFYFWLKTARAGARAGPRGVVCPDRLFRLKPCLDWKHGRDAHVQSFRYSTTIRALVDPSRASAMAWGSKIYGQRRVRIRSTRWTWTLNVYVYQCMCISFHYRCSIVLAKCSADPLCSFS
jgi:hypothetical protein